jgi:hypothetical protein
VVAELLDAFHDVNDPYVPERLYAVAYGCAMRTHDPERVEVLADKTYELVFGDGEPPVNILTRDYAREIIERIVQFDSSASYDMEKVRPPYGSEWPEDLPSLETLEDKYETSDSKYGGGLGQIRVSITTGDFSRYIIGTNSHSFEWSSERLDEPKRQSYEERFEEFKDELDEEQTDILETLRKTRRSISWLVREAKKQLNEDYSEDDLKEEVNDFKEAFRDSLSEKDQETFDEVFWPYIENPQIDDREIRFDLELIQRFILSKILELGYKEELFGEFDDRAVNYRRYGRSGEKPERIGKKYQWIAYYEALARVADNFKFKGLFSDEDD